MSTYQENLKRFTYICLSFTSITFSTEVQARDLPRNYGDEDRDANVAFATASLKNNSVGDPDESAKDSKYNLIGVALFSGDSFTSHAIKTATHSNVSHIGIILSDINDKDKLYCFESIKSGVRIIPWDSEVSDYHGKISYRLLLDVNESITNTTPKRVKDFITEYDRKPYTKNPITLIKAVYGKNSDKSNPSTVFCSELAAKMLMDLDIIQKDNKAASNYLPSDFQNSKGVRLNQGFILTPEIVVK